MPEPEAVESMTFRKAVRMVLDVARAEEWGEGEWASALATRNIQLEEVLKEARQERERAEKAEQVIAETSGQIRRDNEEWRKTIASIDSQFAEMNETFATYDKLIGKWKDAAQKERDRAERAEEREEILGKQVNEDGERLSDLMRQIKLLEDRLDNAFTLSETINGNWMDLSKRLKDRADALAEAVEVAQMNGWVGRYGKMADAVRAYREER